MEKHIKKWFSIGFCTIIVVTMIICLVKPATSFSENENRTLAKLPEFSIDEVISGDYMEDLEKFSSDQFPLRSEFVSIKAHLEKLMGKKESGGVFFAKDGYFIEKPETTTLNTVQSNINSIKKLSDTKKYNVSLMLVPTAYEVLSDKLPYGAYTPIQKEVSELAYKNLSGSNCLFIDPTEALKQNKDEYLYFRTDHHQTSYGSYITYKYLCEQLKIKPYEENQFTTITLSDEFYGTMWSKAPLFGVKGDTISIYEPKFNIDFEVNYVAENKKTNSLYEMSWLDKKDKYSMFLDANHSVITVNSSNKNGKRLAVFKDSYANSILPFLANHYEQLHIIDLRYYNNNPLTYLDENEIDNVLILYNTANFITDTNSAKLGAFIK